MALSPKYQRYADRLQSLIAEGNAVAELERRHGRNTSDTWIGGEDVVRLQAWIGNVNNLLDVLFGPESPQTKHFREIVPHGSFRRVEHAYDVRPIVGVLQGALGDLEHGFLAGQEFIVAGVVFDSVLQQAKYLNSNGYKDPAAVLARVVLADALKRIANAEGIDSSLKASRINEELKKAGRYPQSQWRLIQAWLDVGNAAAHGNFADYDAARISSLIDGIEQFLATELRV